MLYEFGSARLCHRDAEMQAYEGGKCCAQLPCSCSNRKLHVMKCCIAEDRFIAFNLCVRRETVALRQADADC
jgi:hypothetical protein